MKCKGASAFFFLTCLNLNFIVWDQWNGTSIKSLCTNYGNEQKQILFVSYYNFPFLVGIVRKNIIVYLPLVQKKTLSLSLVF
jgi:hypothetical protein